MTIARAATATTIGPTAMTPRSVVALPQRIVQASINGRRPLRRVVAPGPVPSAGNVLSRRRRSTTSLAVAADLRRSGSTWYRHV
jgi:hypothetical protein